MSPGDKITFALFVGCLLAEAWNEYQWRKKQKTTPDRIYTRND